MNQRATARLAWGLWAFAMAVTAAAVVLQIVTRAEPLPSSFAFRGADILLSGVIGSVGALIASRRPRNSIGWLLLTAGVTGAVSYFGQEYVTLSASKFDLSLPLTLPYAWVQNWLWVVAVGVIGIYVLALFPEGRPLSRGWGRFLKVYVPISLVLFSAGIALTPGQLQTAVEGIQNPLSSKPLSDLFGALGGLLFVSAIVGALISLVKRFRRSVGEAREQMKWLVFSASLVALSFLISTPVFVSAGTNTTAEGFVTKSLEIFVILAILSVPIATGIAILRYRLYDIDVVISKAVLFGAIALGIGALYVGVVVGIGAAVGTAGEQNVGLSVAATALVAIAFQPLRNWASRFANRFVYGKRATPHEVLSVLGERIADAYSLDEVLPRLAQLVTDATAASSADVWVRVGGYLQHAAAWPHDPQPGTSVEFAGDEVPMLPGSQRVFPVRHQAELLGAIAVSSPASEPIGSADERLLADLAAHAGLVLRNVRLIEELRASRGRLVAAGDAERRRIERNLHDGAQQHLVALAVNLRLARGMVAGDPAQAETMLEQIQSDAGEALENLRDLARGIYPPLLADRGLAAALQSQAQKAAVTVALECDGIERYAMEAESAVYFCVLEALQNVAKYAGATSATVRLGASNGRLEFSVSDDGSGFDERTMRPGSGLTNMTDRVEALGGTLEIRSAPGAGTTVSGWVRAAPTAPPA